MAEFFKTTRITGLGLEESDSSDSEPDNNLTRQNDTWLNGFRAGLNIIRAHARETLANSNSEAYCRDMTGRMEQSTLKLMRVEKNYSEISKICVDIIDEICEESDKIEEHEGVGGNGDGLQMLNGTSNQLTASWPSLETIILNREKMSQMFDQRSKAFDESFTDTDLKSDAKYTALQKEINLGLKDFERKQKEKPPPSSQESDDEDEDPFILAAKIYARKGDVDYGEESS